MINTNEKSTEEVIGIAREAAEKKGIRHVVVATTRGECGKASAEMMKGSDIELIAVTHSTGFKNIGEQELPEDVRKELKSSGVRIITGTMPFHGIDDCLRKTKGFYSTSIAMADALRLMGQGAKVCVEISCMAVDAGAVPEGEDIIAVAGSRYGADTVLLIKTACTRRILNTRVREVIAKPTEW
ncbi:MAG: hypothetical protein KAU14_00690 [Thermoplasmata archaeon]|nr:hypothetical protein [Thermoplasmata archaeon]